MDVADFQYELPPRAIAETPCDPRDAARLLVFERAVGRARHLRVRDLPSLLDPGDLLILNDTRVLPWRLVGRRATGGRVDVLILERDGERCTGYVKPARKARIGEPVDLEGGALRMTPVEDVGRGMMRFRLTAPDGGVAATLERVGRAPLPPYIRRDGGAGEDVAEDRERYQTVFARAPGAVAAPTAGLHFTDRLLAELSTRGVVTARVTLHVGPGTFAPVRVDRVEEHAMHAERYELPEPTARAVERARSAGRRVIAVGTTSARTLETRARPDRTVSSGAGETDLFLYPGQPIRVLDGLMTNFHLPGSTLLMLVSAFAGRDTVLALYGDAIERGYRFYSFGDAMLVL